MTETIVGLKNEVDWRVLTYEQIDNQFQQYVSGQITTLIGTDFSAKGIATFEGNLKIMISRRDQLNTIVEQLIV